MISGPESDTVTPGSANPRGSVTTPVTLPFASTWAKASELAARIAHPKRMEVLVEHCGIKNASSIRSSTRCAPRPRGRSVRGRLSIVEHEGGIVALEPGAGLDSLSEPDTALDRHQGTHDRIETVEEQRHVGDGAPRDVDHVTPLDGRVLGQFAVLQDHFQVHERAARRGGLGGRP